MINEFEIYHGMAFSRILHGAKAEVSLMSYRDDDNSTYILNGKVGLYIKYSTMRLSPWRFSFTKDQQKNFIELKEKFKHAYLLLICQKDGIVLLSFEEVRKILDEHINAVEWISVSRGRGKMYSVKGSDGKLEFKIGKNSFPEKLFEFF